MSRISRLMLRLVPVETSSEISEPTSNSDHMGSIGSLRQMPSSSVQESLRALRCSGNSVDEASAVSPNLNSPFGSSMAH